MTNKTFNNERKFGIEIEFFFNTIRTVANYHDTQDRIANVIRYAADRGVTVVKEGYNHNTRNYWKLVTDSSVTGDGLELVSPPLKGRRGLAQLDIVLDALNTYGAKVDRTCGVHVHHDINDYTLKNFKNLYASFIKFEKVFDMFVPKSRRANKNKYCKSLQGGSSTYEGMRQMQINNTLAKVKAAKSITELTNVFMSRYVKLNSRSYVKYGTIEFRQHSGSTDFEKLKNWIVLTQHFVNNAMVRNVNFEYSEKWDTLAYFTDVTNMTASKGADAEICDTLKYFKKRAKELAS